MARIKLQGKHFNNIYLGGGDPTNYDHKVAKVVPVDDAPIEVDIYLAQWNFVDLIPTPKLILPGQPVEDGTNAPTGTYGGFPTYAKFTATPGTALGDLLDSIVTQKMWTAYSYAGGFLASFTRATTPPPPAANNIYDSDGDYFNLDGTEAPDPLVPGNVYVWKGWGVTYYYGIHRPAYFEAYPQLSLAQQIVQPYNSVFTFDYAKTELIFEYTSSGTFEIIHGEVF